MLCVPVRLLLSFHFSDCEKCHEDIVNLDDTGLSNHVISCTGKSKLLAEVANNILSASTDPLFRNNVLAHAKQLKEVRISQLLF